jgi:magnesium-transporting ATPase (P-type)
MTDQLLASPYARAADEVVTEARSDAELGLTEAETTSRLATYGQNHIAAERRSSRLCSPA